jgi:hypothetical protein
MTSEEVAITGLDWVQGKEEPLETFSRRLEKIAWDDVALDDRVGFDANLRSAGLSEQSVLEALAVRDLAADELLPATERLKPYENVSFFNSPPDYIEAQQFYFTTRRSALERLRDWWRQRVTVIDFIEPVTVRIPLFVLGTPSFQGCTAKWTHEITSGVSAGGTLEIAGSGLGSDAGSTYISSASFEASSDDTKLVFCDVRLRLEHVEIREPTRPAVRQWRIDLTSVDEGRISPGLLQLNPGQVPLRGEFFTRYPLAGDRSASLAHYTETYIQKVRKQVTVGLDVKGFQMSLTTSSDYSSGVKVEYALRGGADYELFYAQKSEGLLFG